MQPEKPEYFAPACFPVFNLLVPEGRYYGFPIFGVPGFKFSKYHHFEESGEAEYLATEPNQADEVMLREFTSRYFPDGAGPTMTLATCMFTNAPDGHFIIDTHPQYPQISFASACSGHGYKFASVIGEIMADLAERGESRHDISLFQLARFRNGVALHQNVTPSQSNNSGVNRRFVTSPASSRFSQPSELEVTKAALYWERHAIKPFW